MKPCLRLVLIKKVLFPISTGEVWKTVFEKLPSFETKFLLPKQELPFLAFHTSSVLTEIYKHEFFYKNFEITNFF